MPLPSKRACALLPAECRQHRDGEAWSPWLAVAAARTCFPTLSSVRRAAQLPQAPRPGSVFAWTGCIGVWGRSQR